MTSFDWTHDEPGGQVFERHEARPSPEKSPEIDAKKAEKLAKRKQSENVPNKLNSKSIKSTQSKKDYNSLSLVQYAPEILIKEPLFYVKNKHFIYEICN